MNFFQSKQFAIKIDNSTLICGSDWSLNTSREVTKVGCLDADTNNYIPLNIDWTASISGNLVYTSDVSTNKLSYYQLQDKLIAGADVSVAFVPDVSGTIYYSGSGIITSVTLSGSVDSVVTYSADIQGRTDLVKQTK